MNSFPVPVRILSPAKWYIINKATFENSVALTDQGFDVVDIVVDLDELTEYCRLRGIKNDGKARSQFVQAK